MIVQGIDTNNVSRPLLVDASGRVIVSGIELTTTGGKVLIDASGRPLVGSYPHDVYTHLAATQIFKSNTANNNRVTVHTVTAGKTFYMTSMCIDTANLVAGGNYAAVELYDATPTLLGNWLAGVYGANEVFYTLPLPIPMKLLAAYTVKVFSPSANVYGTATITGYEI